jgi:hypothetical protein
LIRRFLRVCQEQMSNSIDAEVAGKRQVRRAYAPKGA